jgi:hypothetical protein
MLFVQNGIVQANSIAGLYKASHDGACDGVGAAGAARGFRVGFGKQTFPGRKVMLQSAKVSRRSVLTGMSATGLSAAGLSAIGSPSFAQNAPAVQSKTKIVVTGFYRTPAFHIAQRRGLFAK